MPYQVKNEGSKFCVHKKMDDGSMGRKFGCHDTKPEAMAQMRALYASEGKKKEIEDIDLELKELGLDEKAIEAMTTKCYGEMTLMGWVPWGVKSWEELDAWKEAQHMASTISMNTNSFTRMVENVMGDYEMGMNEKMSAVKELADGFPDRMDDSEHKEAPEAAKEEPARDEESLVERVFAKVKGLLGIKDKAKDNGFMVYKEADGSTHWIARYSNNFRDQDNPPEIISSASHQRFVDRVEKGLAPLPELWIWHVKEWRIGQTDWVTYDPDTGFAVAGGHSLPGMDEAFDRLASKETLVSHGMPKSLIVRDEKDPTIILEHETRELSPLPPRSAANKLTGFVVLDPELKEANMAIPADKRETLKKEYGFTEEMLVKIEAANAADASKALDEGLEHKENEAAPPAAEPAAAKPVTEAPVSAPMEVKLSAAEMVAALNEAIAPVIEKLNALDGEVKALKEKAAPDQDAITKALERPRLPRSWRCSAARSRAPSAQKRHR